jgi:hypothetical protein
MAECIVVRLEERFMKFEKPAGSPTQSKSKEERQRRTLFDLLHFFAAKQRLREIKGRTRNLS